MLVTWSSVLIKWMVYHIDLVETTLVTPDAWDAPGRLNI